MDKIIVVVDGHSECSVNNIVRIVCESPDHIQLVHRWQNLSQILEIDINNIDRLRRIRLFNDQSVVYALEEILTHWVVLWSRDATLARLIDAFRRSELPGIADLLQNRFSYADVVTELSTKIYDAPKWQDLDIIRQSELLNKNVWFLGRLQSISHIWRDFRKDRLDLLLSKSADPLTLRNILRENNFVLARNTISRPLEYYIGRKLTFSSASAHKLLNEDIFKQENLQDIFVVGGIRWRDLSVLARSSKGGTHRSSCIFQLATKVKFILLDHDQDFDNICKLSSDRPVHLIRFRDGGYYLEKSHGNTCNLEKFLSDKIEEICEADFISSLSPDSNKPECISDTPGMGKTRLLESIARQMRQNFPNSTVIFLRMREFLRDYVKKGLERDYSVLRLIAVQVSQNRLGQEILLELMESRANQVELFFDGFDEILTDELDIAKSLLKEIIQNFKNIRIFVTTRPHKRQEVEELLGVKAHNILPFQESDQINFLSRYWHFKSKSIKAENFTEFAQISVKTLKSNMNDFERDIAGIPLQCMLLGDAYLQQAINYSRTGCITDYGITFRVNSISSMFKMHMEIRFSAKMGQRNACDLDKLKEVRNLHVFHATKFLFPEWSDTLQSLLIDINTTQLDISDLFPFGILEISGESDKVIRFIHRTLAEYLLAEFLAEAILADEKKYSSEDISGLAQFLFGTVLKTEEYSGTILATVMHEHLGTRMYKFKYPVMCYFINSHVEVDNWSDLDMTHLKACLTTNHADICKSGKIQQLLSGCALDNYRNLISLIKILFISADSQADNLTTPNPSQPWADIIAVAAAHENRELLEDLCQIVYQIEGKKLSQLLLEFPHANNMTPMHVAARKGNFKNVEFLLEELGHHLRNLKYLLHSCIDGSAEDSRGMVNRKEDIMGLIIDVDSKFLDEREPIDDRTPLLMDDIHFELIKFLIDEGVDLGAATKTKGSTFLHKAATYLSPKEFHELLHIVVKKGKDEILKTCDADNLTPVHVAIACGRLEPEAAAFLLQWVQHFGSTDLIVGDTECDFDSIVNVLTSSPVSSVLVTQWTDLSSKLKTPSDLVVKLKQDKLLDKETYKDVLKQILEKWRMEYSNDATLNKLVEALRKCKWNDMADSLSTRFHRTDEETLKAAFTKFQTKR